jgi:hypothetical protein
MALRRLAPLCLTLLAPSLAWAAPPDDRPPVQRPTKPVSGETETTVDAQAPEAPVGETAAPAEPAPIEPAPAETPTPTSADPPTHPAEPAEEEKDLSNLLASDEPEAEASRVRVSDDRTRVDRSERMRNYYARIYRPPENPSRLYLGARGAYALAGTTNSEGGGRMGFGNVELGQTWNYIGYALGATIMAGDLTFGDYGVAKYGGVLVGGGPSLGLGRLGLFGRGYLDFRVGYNFFFAPVSSTRPELSNPPDASPHGPKVQVDAGLLLHDSESRRFRHGLGATIGWQMLVHTFTGEYPRVNTFIVGFGYFFG